MPMVGMAEVMLLVMLVAMPLAPEPYRTMSTAWMRSAVPLGAVTLLGFSADVPGPASMPPSVSAQPATKGP